MSDMNKNEQRRKKTISCGAVVHRLNDGISQILLIKPYQNKDVWGIPKGHIDPGETYEQCAMREVKEETNLTVVLGDRLPMVTTYNHKEEKDVYTFLAVQSCNSEPKNNDPDEEIDQIEWFDINKLPEIHNYQKLVIEDCVVRVKNIHDVRLARGEYETAIQFVFKYASTLNDWVSIKREMLKTLNSDLKSHLSTREPITKKQQFNDLEKAISARWSELSGIQVLFKA